MKGFKLHSRFARIYCDRSDLSRFHFFEGLHKLKDLSELKTVTVRANDLAPDIKYIPAECIARNLSCNPSREILELLSNTNIILCVVKVNRCLVLQEKKLRVAKEIK